MTMCPQNTAEAAEIIKAARADKKAVVPGGRLTRLSQWPDFEKFSGQMVSAEKMTQVVSVEPENLLAIVGAGLTAAEVAQALAPAGLCWPVSGQDNRTLGAMMAEGAVSLETMAKGPMTDWILGITFVDPYGRQISSGGRTLKNVSGYDLTRILWKSWGSLGFATSFILKCLPKPEMSLVVEIPMPDAKAASAAIQAIIKARIFPQGIHAVRQNDGQWAVLVWLVGFDDYIKTQMETMKGVVKDGQFELHQDGAAFWQNHQAAWPLGGATAGSWLGSRNNMIKLLEGLSCEAASIDRADIDVGGGLARFNFSSGQPSVSSDWPSALQKIGYRAEGEIYSKIKNGLDPDDLFFPASCYPQAG